MSEEIAIIKKIESAWNYGGSKEFGSMYDLIVDELRRLHAENESLRLGMAKQANAVTLMRSANEDVAKTLAEQGVIVELSQLRSQLESEREANSKLTAENEAMRKDAGRYDWLANDMDGNDQCDFLDLVNMCVLDREHFDQAIDTAMGGVK